MPVSCAALLPKVPSNLADTHAAWGPSPRRGQNAPRAVGLNHQSAYSKGLRKNWMFHRRESEEKGTSSQNTDENSKNQLNDVQDFIFLNRHGLHLYELEASQCYSSLKICILSKNFIMDMSPLKNCTQLIKLDLHSNQIRIVPDRTFWSAMKQLKLLYLHDNSFVKLKNVCSLSACQNLIALTLYDCPVSLKKGYRHVIVNSIWSLKLLDNFVVSDEEIIENWELPERFKTLSKHLFCDITPVLVKGSNYEKELFQMNYVISKINRVVAHNSPVVILQRWIRGHLTRRMWKKNHLKLLQRKILSDKVRKMLKKDEEKIGKEEQKWNEENEEEKPSASEDKVKSIYMGKDLHCKLLSLKHKAFLSRALSELRRIETPVPFPKLSHIKVSKVSREEQTADQEMDFNFRIPGIKVHLSLPPIYKYSSKSKEIKQETQHRPIYRLCHFIDGQSKFKVSHPLEREKKKEFPRQQCTLDLSPFYSIDRQYRDRENMKKIQKKRDFVEMSLFDEEIARGNIEEYIQEKLNFIKKRNEDEGKKYEESLLKSRETRLKLREELQKKRNSFLEKFKIKIEEREMVKSLCNQHSTLGREMFQFDRYNWKQDIMKKKQTLVNEIKEKEKRHKELIKKMQKGRMKAIRKRHIEERIIIHTIGNQKATDRIQEAKENVAAMKTHRVHFTLPLDSKKSL
ncbi:leucine-rich repeat and IQ domain-containing protein 3 isoform X2 [Antechinus flavipes]|uniref:leucine-rich repeat and IQ domain-containing protein 3 isoform X2 n=1 Tax=Antechinus flavipes TaxID=38775 RepID=UPI0022365D7B|nr:leucine-rich repeat and IQ domain-containing protein 3 isoform X2 [Antechinus flavipes]